MIRLVKNKDLVALLFSTLLALAACSDGGSSTAAYEPPPLPDGSTGVDASSPPDAGSALDAAPWTGDAALVRTCPVNVRWVPPVGERPHAVAFAGTFNAFALPGLVLQGPDADGAFAGTLDLAPGAYAYKVVVDGQWRLDDGEGKRIYEGGVENSMLEVVDCNKPALRVVSTQTTRAAKDQGVLEAWVRASEAQTGVPLATASVVDRHDFQATALAVDSFDLASGWLHLSLHGLADGKHSVDVTVTDAAGRASEVLHLVTWVEAERFAWNDAVIYMAMIDRFADGDAASNAAPISGVDSRADFQGGDLWGLRDAVRSGTFDRLGVRALWLSPFHRNPQGAYSAANGITKVTGYHGYWPIKAREVDPRLGGADALKALVKEAHAHGIRILQDFVVNHVHQEHEYLQSHPEWFRTGCVCGTSNCDWTTHRLECLFAPYLPDVNWTVPAAAKAYVDDAAYWVDTFELDGLRVDAVKHVEDVAVRNISAGLRGRFESAGTKLFLTGEIAMGWNECSAPNCPGNDENYGTISRYIGPKAGLDGAFDFVLYHAASYKTFAYEDRGLAHADYWLKASLEQFPADAIMTPYIGSQDTSRFATMATYRGQAGFPRDQASRQWDSPGAAPADDEAFGRQRLGLAWLLTIPGAPMMYYGDEYGEVGAADPNNRAKWRGAGTLNANEVATRALTEKLGSARMELPSLRRGGYRTLVATDDFLAFSRELPTGEAAVVALARTPGSRRVVLPPSLAARFSGSLRDRLSGTVVPVSSNALDLTLPAHGAMVLAP